MKPFVRNFSEEIKLTKFFVRKFDLKDFQQLITLLCREFTLIDYFVMSRVYVKSFSEKTHKIFEMLFCYVVFISFCYFYLLIMASKRNLFYIHLKPWWNMFQSLFTLSVKKKKRNTTIQCYSICQVCKNKNFIFNAYIKKFLERLCKWSLFLFVITSRSNRILTFKL